MTSTNLASIEQIEQFLELTRSLEIWIDGGWGVDALLRKQTREHSDLDIILADQEVEQLSKLLESHGYKTKPRQGLLYVSPEGLAVDVHWVRFDQAGYGHFDLPDGGSWPLPPSAFRGRGCIGSTEVICLSAEAQVQCHAQGYEPTEKDIADMHLLQQAFEVVLPLPLCRRAPE